MYSGSSINLPAADVRPMQSNNYRSKLKSFIRRLGLHSTQHRDITHLQESQLMRSSISLTKSFSSHAVEAFDNDYMAWSRPSSRATTSSPSARTKRHRLRATSPEGPAEMLDDENNAWTRPSTDVSSSWAWGSSRA